MWAAAILERGLRTSTLYGSHLAAQPADKVGTDDRLRCAWARSMRSAHGRSRASARALAASASATAALASGDFSMGLCHEARMGAPGGSSHALVWQGEPLPAASRRIGPGGLIGTSRADCR